MLSAGDKPPPYDKKASPAPTFASLGMLIPLGNQNLKAYHSDAVILEQSEGSRRNTRRLNKKTFLREFFEEFEGLFCKKVPQEKDRQIKI